MVPNLSRILLIWEYPKEVFLGQFYSLYTSMICLLRQICFSFSKFADDTSLLLSSDSELYDKQISTELKKVMGWFSCNKLLLNYLKSQYIFFGPLYPTQYVKEFLLKDLYDVCPQYLLLK